MCDPRIAKIKAFILENQKLELLFLEILIKGRYVGWSLSSNS